MNATGGGSKYIRFSTQSIGNISQTYLQLSNSTQTDEFVLGIISTAVLKSLNKTTPTSIMCGLAVK